MVVSGQSMICTYPKTSKYLFLVWVYIINSDLAIGHSGEIHANKNVFFNQFTHI